MQNKESSIKIIANNFQDSYQRFFSEITAEANLQVQVQPQMPAFQRDLFLQQAHQRKAIIQIQLNPYNLQSDIRNIQGNLTVDQHGRLLLTEPSQQVVHLINRSQIRYIQLV